MTTYITVPTIGESDWGGDLNTALEALDTAIAAVDEPSSDDISDATTVGKAVLTASSESAARTAIGAGTSSLAIGTTSTTAKAGNYAPASSDISDATTTGKSLLTTASASAARTTLGLATVANTGSYDDLTDTPTLADIATSGSADDLTSGTTNKVFTASEKTKLDAITGTNTGDQTTITGNAGSATKLQTARNINGVSFDGSADITVPAAALSINAQTGTTYTLVLTDASKLVTLDNASAITLTVPPNSSVAFPTGTVVEGAQLGAGQVTIAEGSGVTVNGNPGLIVSGQYSPFALIKTDTNTWLAVGQLVDS